MTIHDLINELPNLSGSDVVVKRNGTIAFKDMRRRSRANLDGVVTIVPSNSHKEIVDIVFFFLSHDVNPCLLDKPLLKAIIKNLIGCGDTKAYYLASSVNDLSLMFNGYHRRRYS